MSFTWQNGRQLAGISRNGAGLASYTYNADGLRTSKAVKGVTTEYYWLNGTLQRQKTGDESIFFLYDESGNTYGFIVKNGTEESTYYYEFNVQGDIVGIIDSTGTKVVEYTYGAWGDILSVTGVLADTIGQRNPLRYRGYYYDAETGFYYLTSRYYDAEICRFINADSVDVLGISEELSDALYDNNLFAYCDNNPVTRVDNGGDMWELALAGGGTMAGWGVSLSSIGSSIMVGLGAITPVGWAVIGITAVVVTVAVVSYSQNKSKSKSKEKSKEEKLKVKVDGTVILPPETTVGINNLRYLKNIRLEEVIEDSN